MCCTQHNSGNWMFVLLPILFSPVLGEGWKFSWSSQIQSWIMVFRLGEKVDTQNKDREKGNDRRRTKDTRNEFCERHELTKCLKRNIQRNLLEIISFFVLNIWMEVQIAWSTLHNRQQLWLNLILPSVFSWVWIVSRLWTWWCFWGFESIVILGW